jgi:hypothetical protein
MMRKQALGAIFLTLGAINCIRERPQETRFFPRPVAIREGDFFRAATNIKEQRIFEFLSHFWSSLQTKDRFIQIQCILLKKNKLEKCAKAMCVDAMIHRKEE